MHPGKRDSSYDERRPLLLPSSALESQTAERRATPLPMFQLSIILMLQLGEPLSSQLIYPFINQLVGGLDIIGGDPRKIGYYAGMIESLFYASQAVFVLSWSRTSDHIGRKPVLLIGLAGTCFSMVSFGFSRTFWGLVVSRCFLGMTNGNVGVLKSMMGEITDSTNITEAYGFLPIMWALGLTIGPIIGGTFSCPHERFPSLFGNKFWVKYPYLLPCIFSASVAAVSFIVTALFLKETVHKSLDNTSSEQDQEQAGPLPLRSLMTRPILLSISAYCLLALPDICFFALQPLFYSTDIELGGLGLDSVTIGICLAVYGVMSGVIQVAIFTPVINRWGPRNVLFCGFLTFIPLFGLFPVINHMARIWGLSSGVWAILVCQLFLVVIMDMAFGAVFILITASVPSRRSLGTVNGMSQMTVSITRAIGPAAATSLFAYSKQTNWMGGNAVYYILMSVSILGVWLTTYLPERPWDLLS